MGTVWASVFMTLDGVVDAPEEWMAPVASDQSYGLLARDVVTADRMLLGATTFAELSSFWPTQSDEVPMATVTNEKPKTVASTSLREASWGPDTRVTSSAEDYVRDARAAGTSLVVSGSPQVVRALLAAGLLDEVRLFLVPHVRGAGRRLFATDGPGVDLGLIESRPLPHGVVYLRYAVR